MNETNFDVVEGPILESLSNETGVAPENIEQQLMPDTNRRRLRVREIEIIYRTEAGQSVDNLYSSIERNKRNSFESIHCLEKFQRTQ